MAKNRKPTPIETKKLCHYGCGLTARYLNLTGRLMCESSSSKCPANREKNSNGLKKKHLELKMLTGNSSFFNYSSLPQESKDRMNHNKGKTIASYAPLQKKLQTWRENYHIHQGNAKPRGFAVDPTLRWKRYHIPYIDSAGNLFNLESLHEWKVANELDKNSVYWIRPKKKLN